MPVLYSATPADLRDAVARIRERVKNLRAPKLYHAAVTATVLARSGQVQEMQNWESVPSASARDVQRVDVGWAISQLFMAPIDAFLLPNAPARPAMVGVSHVVLDLLYDAGRSPLTLVARTGNRLRDALKLPIGDESWIWNQAGGATSPSRTIEYNPINTWGQQNGVRCGLSVQAALGTGDPASAYAVGRINCAHHTIEGRCDLNNDFCARMDGETSRLIGKPRLFVPFDATGSSRVLLPGGIRKMVDEATGSGSMPLPRSEDMSLVAGWCAAGGGENLDHSRLASLLGGSGIRLLTEVT